MGEQSCPTSETTRFEVRRSNLGRINSISVGIKRFFGELDEQCQRHVTAVYQKVFCHQLLNLDPLVHAAQRTALGRTRGYLDTNIAVDLLTEHSDESKATTEVLRGLLSQGVQLLVSPMTVQELIRLRDSAMGAQGLIEDPRVRGILEVRPGASTNPFVAGFLYRRGAAAGLTWVGYMARFRDIEQLLLNSYVLVEEEAAPGLQEHRDYQGVVASLRAIRPYVGGNVIDHDAQNFLLVHELRKRHTDNVVMGPSVWLITRDRSLIELENRVRDAYPVPHSKQIMEWGEILLPLQMVGTFTARDYIAYLLQATLGILPESDGIDLNFLAMLKQLEQFDLNGILQLDPPYAAEILVSLQSDREVISLAERAIKEGPESRVAVVQELNEKVLTTMAESHEHAIKAVRSAEERVAGAELVLGSLEEEVVRFRGEIQELKSRLTQYETSSLWSRFLQLFRRPKRTVHDVRQKDDTPE